MTFLAIIIAVLLQQAWSLAERVQHDHWFDGWRARVGALGFGDWLGLALAVLVPTVLAHLVLDAVEPVLFGLGWLLLAIVLLLYSFGRGDFQAAMAQYRGHAYSGDFEAAYLAASEQFNWENDQHPPDTALEVHARVQRVMLYEGFQRWFAVMFYFVLLGPAGALAYRLSQLYCEASEVPSVTALRWLALLDWVPVRLLASTFTVTGDFIGSRDELLASLTDPAANAQEVLYSVGVAALDPDVCDPSGDEAVFGPEAAAQNREFEALLSRSAIGWIVVLSLLILLF